MALYNAEQFIGEALDSIMCQTYANWELIIVDDCSTDKSLEIIKKYSDDRIILLQNKINSGPAISRNKALNAAKGEYVAVLDADDIMFPNRLEIQVNYLIKHTQIDILGTSALMIDECGNKLTVSKYYMSPEEIKTTILFRCPLIHSSVMMRKAFLVNNDLSYNENFPCNQDYELWSRVVFLGNIRIIPDVLVKYRISPNQISQKKRQKQLDLALSLRKSYLKKQGLTLSINEIEIFNEIENRYIPEKEKVEDIIKRLVVSGCFNRTTVYLFLFSYYRLKYSHLESIMLILKFQKSCSVSPFEFVRFNISYFANISYSLLGNLTLKK